MADPPQRRRPRRGSLDRPVSGRIYRAAWVVVAVPLLVAAFSVGRSVALQQPRLPPSFDRVTATQFATDFVKRYPDRSPGSDGARGAADWVAERFTDYLGKDSVERQEFTAEVPGRGTERFVNLVALPPIGPSQDVARSRETIVVMAHRDNLGASPGVNDNASGTAALLELARDIGSASLSHTLLFLSADGGVYGNLGAVDFVRRAGAERRIIAVINLDAIAGNGAPRLEWAGETPRSPGSTLVATAEASIRAQAAEPPDRPAPLGQLIDLAFPFTLYGQGPFIARGTPAITLTTAGSRPPAPRSDTLASFKAEKLDELGSSTQALVAALDGAAEVARGTDSYIAVGDRLVRGWTIQFVLLAALIPFIAATIDLFARCRRRHIALGPALRSFASRLGVWTWAAALFAFFAVAGILPNGAARPISADSAVAGNWPVAALLALSGLSFLGWLAARPNLRPRPGVSRSDELGGHLAAMLVLGIVALVVAAQNPFALVFVLPSLHAWLWLPQMSDRGRHVELGVFAAGFLGPLLLLGSFAFRFDFGLDAPWYVLALVSVGYVQLPLVAAFVAWCAVAEQVGAVVLRRYAPFPATHERPLRGPVRESVRQAVLFGRRLRSSRSRERETAEERETLDD